MRIASINCDPQNLNAPALQWRAVETMGQKPAPRAEHCAAAAAGKLFIVGGQRMSTQALKAKRNGTSAALPASVFARACHDLCVP